MILGAVDRIAGVDVAYLRETHESVATVVVLSFPQLEVLETAVSRIATPFPYVPGLLSFREIPALLPAFEGLCQQPQIVFVDGHGVAHPRRFGIACHLGLWLEIPTIGIGKSKLCGEFAPPGIEKGSSTPLTAGGELIGVALRSRRAVRPIFVSVGFGLPLKISLEWTLRVTPRYRIPEPIRMAHNLAARAKLGSLSGQKIRA